MAATNLGILNIDLVVNIVNFIEPINQAERKAKSASENIGQSFKTIGSTMKSVSDFMNNQIVAGLTSTVTRVIDTGSEIKKLAQLANTSTSSFQYYAKGAETVGISMDKFANQLNGMQQNIGNFQQTGGGPLADFFKNIAPQVGVTISQFQKLSGPDALQLYYDSLVKANVSQESMRFYMEALISDSTALIPLLENGGAGFKKWGDAAQRAGNIMDDAMIKKLSQAKENLQIMDLQWQGLQATMVNGIMPVFIAVTSHMDTITAAAVGLGAAMVAKEFAMWAIEGVRTVATFASVTIASLQTATAMGVLRGAVAFLGGPAGIAMLAFQAVVAGGAYYLMTQQTKDTTEALSDQGLTIDELKEKYKKLNAEQLKIKSLDVADEINKQNKIVSDTFSQLDRRVYNLLTGAGTEKQAGALQQYIDDLKAGGDRAAQALNVLSSTNIFNDDQLRSIADFGLKIKGATDEIQRQKDIQSIVENVTDETTKAQKNQTKGLTEAEKAWNDLTKAQRDYITQSKQDALREKYIKDLVGRGFSTDKATAFAEAQGSTNGNNAYKVPLTDSVRKATEDSFKRKNYTPSPLEKKAIAYVQSLASANNFSKIESLRGLPSGTLAALILNESSGNPNARSKTGARGLLQTTKIFRDEYQLTDKSTLEEIVTAAAEDLKKNRERFGGSLEKALIAYNAGPTGTANYLAGNIGHKKGQMSPEKAKEVAGYVPRYQKWFAAVNGKSTVDNSILMPTETDQLEAINKAAEAQKAIDDMQKEVNSNYLTVPQKLAQDHKDRTEKAIIAFGGTDKLKEVLAQEDALYKAQLAKFTSDTKDQYNQYFAFETDRIKQIEQNYDRQKELIDTDATYQYGKSKEALEIKAGFERKKQVEIAAVKREEDAQIQSAFEGYLNQTEVVVKRYQREREEILQTYSLSERVREEIAKSKDYAIFETLNKASDSVFQVGQNSAQSLFSRLDPEGFSKWNLQNQYSTDYGALNESHNNDVAGIGAIEDEDLRNSMLLNAHEQYLQSKAALDADYAQKELDLNQQNFETKMQVYSQIAGMTGQVFDQMANMVAESAGKSNALYKTMFLASKAASIAQAIVNTEEGATKALAQGGAYGSILATFVRATGYASVGIMAAQTIQGFATGGQIRGLGNGLSDSIPIWASNEEFMIKQSSAKKIGLDNLNYMNQTGELPQTESSQIIVPQLAELPPTGSAINAPVSVNVTVNSDGSSQVDSSGQYKLVGEVLGNTIRQVLLQELRQGRILYNAIRG